MLVFEDQHSGGIGPAILKSHRWPIISLRIEAIRCIELIQLVASSPRGHPANEVVAFFKNPKELGFSSITV